MARGAMRRGSAAAAWLMITLASSPAGAQDGSLSPEQAAGREGEIQTVCGRVAEAGVATGKAGETVLLYLDRPAQKAVFAAVIPAEARADFAGSPGKILLGREICVTGRIRMENRLPRIVVRGAWQIEDLEKTRQKYRTAR
jgi:hypothetical protein